MARPANPFVGPPALRRGWRTPAMIVDTSIAAVTDTNFVQPATMLSTGPAVVRRKHGRYISDSTTAPITDTNFVQPTYPSIISSAGPTVTRRKHGRYILDKAVAAITDTNFKFPNYPPGQGPRVLAILRNRADVVAWLKRAFPTEYPGLRIETSSQALELSVVAEVDAPADMGGVVKIQRTAGKYVVYLVETNDPFASPMRIKTNTGTKSVRKSTFLPTATTIFAQHQPGSSHVYANGDSVGTGTIGFKVSAFSGGVLEDTTEIAPPGLSHSTKCTKPCTIPNPAQLKCSFTDNRMLLEPYGVWFGFDLYVPTVVLDDIQGIVGGVSSQIKCSLSRQISGATPGWCVPGLGRAFGSSRTPRYDQDSGTGFWSLGTKAPDLGDGVWKRIWLNYDRKNGVGTVRAWENEVLVGSHSTTATDDSGTDDPTDNYYVSFGISWLEIGTLPSEYLYLARSWVANGVVRW